MAKRILDPAKIIQNLYSDASQVQRTANAGMAIKPIGEISSAKRVGKAASIMIYNSSNAVVFVAFGSQSISAPSSPSNGIPILAGEKVFINSGDDEWIRASSNSVYAYASIGDDI